MKIVDQTSVFTGIYDGDSRHGQLCQIGRAADIGQDFILLEQPLEGDRVGDLAALDQPGAGFENAPMWG